MVMTPLLYKNLKEDLDMEKVRLKKACLYTLQNSGRRRCRDLTNGGNNSADDPAIPWHVK